MIKNKKINYNKLKKLNNLKKLLLIILLNNKIAYRNMV